LNLQSIYSENIIDDKNFYKTKFLEKEQELDQLLIKFKEENLKNIETIQ